MMRTRHVLVSVASVWVSSGALAAQIYTCVDDSGKRRTSDRPIVECNTKEQRVLNSDGSLKQVVQPPMTADERAEADAREAKRAADRVAQQDAIRRDRNLLNRYPNEATHSKAREAALNDVRKAIDISKKRLAALKTERKPLADEAEFYVKRQMPGNLRQQLDANDAATSAQESLIANQQSEMERVTGLFDAELAHLKRLWAGAAPGSLGEVPAAAAASGASKTVKR